MKQTKRIKDSETKSKILYMQAELQSFLLPFCHAGDDGLLAQVGTNSLFDRNVIGLVAQFAVRLTFPHLIAHIVVVATPHPSSNPKLGLRGYSSMPIQ